MSDISFEKHNTKTLYLIGCLPEPNVIMSRHKYNINYVGIIIAARYIIRIYIFSVCSEDACHAIFDR